MGGKTLLGSRSGTRSARSRPPLSSIFEVPTIRNGTTFLNFNRTSGGAKILLNFTHTKRIVQEKSAPLKEHRETFNVSLPIWIDRIGNASCSIPPSDQFAVHSRENETAVSTKRSTSRRRVAFLLMEYQSVTFPRIWSRYFRDADPRDFLLYVYIQKSRVSSIMTYNEYRRDFPDDSLLAGLTVSSSLSNLVILPSNKKTTWGNLMPTLLDFWTSAVRDDSVAGFLYMSGSCLPLKPFSYVHRTIMSFHSALSILNFANVFRTKASMWGYHSRRAAVEMLPYTAELTNKTSCRKTYVGPSASEEICPAAMMPRLGLPTQHGITTFDCWSRDKLYTLMNSTVHGVKLRKSNPCQFLATDSSMMDRLFQSGAFFARKFEKHAVVADLNTTVQRYIMQKVLEGPEGRL
mmetsp:Transcript_13862/g.31110  ORF Transcript_13862/g.31110 Transcript_13862/m.31110 type:complete len:405 (+) Transcript_13862:230-1444(+)